MDERTAFASLRSSGCDLTFVRRRIASAGQSLYASSLPVFFREPCRALSGEVPNHQCPPPSAELERGPANRRESRYSSQCSLVFKCVARLTKPTPNGTINFL